MKRRISCFLLSCTVLLSGCYSESALVKDESTADDEVAFFYLRTGTCVQSGAGQHTREEGRYRVVGILVKEGKAQGQFSGLIPVGEIQRITVKRLDVVRTSLGVVFGAVGVLVIVGVFFFKDFGGLSPGGRK